MVRTLNGRIVILPSKTPNGDYVPGVIEMHQVRGSNVSRQETGNQPRYSFLPEHFGPDLEDEFNGGKLKEPVAVRVIVEDSPGVYSTVSKRGIQRRV